MACQMIFPKETLIVSDEDVNTEENIFQGYGAVSFLNDTKESSEEEVCVISGSSNEIEMIEESGSHKRKNEQKESKNIKKGKIQSEASDDEVKNAHCSDNIMNLPSPDAKGRLMCSLKELRAINYAVNFCDILIKGEEAENEGQGNLHYTILLENLQNVTKHEKDNIVKQILKVLCKMDAGAGGDLLSILEQISNPKSSDMGPKQYFVQILAAVNFLTKTVCDELFSTRCAVTPLNKKDLHMLKFFLIKSGFKQAKSVLLTLFEFCLPNMAFSEDEKKEIGALIAENIMLIEKSITSTFLGHLYFLGLDVVKQRSAFQLISDNFTNTQLRNHMDKIYHCMKILDNLIFDYFEEEKLNFDDMDDDDDNDSSCNYFESENEKDFIDAGGSKVPDHHTWWKEYRSVYFDKKK